MSVFVSITSNLPKNKDDSFEATSEEEYTLSGVTSPSTKILYVDEEIVEISPLTYSWTKKVKAPRTGAKLIHTHIVKAFGHEGDVHQISSSFNAVRVLILPPC